MAANSAFLTNVDGEYERDDKGKPKRDPQWRVNATDTMGRKHHPRLHGEHPEVDAQGFLKVKRRDSPKPMNPGAQLDDVLSLHKAEGYAYYFINTRPGRREKMEAHDWEAVQGSDGPVQIKLPSRDSNAEHTLLMRKPLEWYEEDQRLKEDKANHNLVDRRNLGSDPARLADGYDPKVTLAQGETLLR